MQLDPKKTVFLIDGSSFLYRAYYGMRPLHGPDGKPIQAVYSFCRMIKKLLDKFDPHYISLVWDSKGKTERHAIYAEYKATRQAAPSDLFEQKNQIIAFADLIGLHQVSQIGVEADDLLYSLAKDFASGGYKIVLITSDKDMFQLLDSQIVVFDAFKDEFLTREQYEAKLGFSATKIPFYFALLGDSSDNIPGVRGVGAKGATDLVKQFKNLDDLYENLRQVDKGKTREALRENRTNAYLSFDLFSLRYHHLNLTLNALEFKIDNWQKARELFRTLNFKSLLKELDDVVVASGSEATPKQFFADVKNYRFLPITDESLLIHVCQKLKTNLFAIDTETTGLDVFKAQLVGISLCYEKGLAYYIPLGHSNILGQLDQSLVFKHLKPILEDRQYAKCLHNAKFDQHVLAKAGINLAGVIFDTMLAAHLLINEEAQRVGLKHLSFRYFGDEMLSYSELVKTFKIKDFSDVNLELAVKYAAADAHQTFLLYHVLKEQLVLNKLSENFYNIELPLVQVLFEMEQAGIYLNQEKLASLGLEVDHKIKELITEINLQVELGADFNLNSPRQVEELLFGKLQLPPQKRSAGRTSFSTDQEVLEFLAKLHSIPKLILKYRELIKLKTTYIDALPAYISKHDDRIHTSFSQVATSTGRLASSDPNLQNIPVVSDGARVRAAFEAQGEHVFLSLDYSQVELRVLAYLSQDQALLSAFQNNLDIHKLTACSLFDVETFALSHDMRQIGKRINFSVLYGLTPYGLSKDLKISLNDAKKYITKFFAQYPDVQKWMDKIVDQATDCGYVQTLGGRRRYVPGLKEKNKNLYDAARRIAVNTVVQGTAAELVKKGMLALKKGLKKHQAQMLLQIHDEIIISVGKDHSLQVEQIAKQILETVVDWNVPLQVTTRLGHNWQEVSK